MGAQRSKPLKKLILLFASVLVALVLAEIAVRTAGRGPLHVTASEVVFWQFDSLLGWSHPPRRQGIFAARHCRMHVRINSKGLRDREHRYKRRGSTKRVLVLGDSLAWGHGVEEDSRLSERLEALLGVDVINAGVSGYSTDQELLWFQTEGVRYDVDSVVLVFCGNDPGMNYKQRGYYIYNKPRFVLHGDNLDLRGVPVPKIDLVRKMAWHVRRRSALIHLIAETLPELLARAGRTTGTEPHSDPGTTRSPRPFKLTIRLMDEMRRVATDRGAQFLVVACSSWWRGPPSGGTYGTLIDALRADGFQVIDVDSLPGFDPARMTIPDDGHWNASGHAFVACAIRGCIEQPVGVHAHETLEDKSTVNPQSQSGQPAEDPQ